MASFIFLFLFRLAELFPIIVMLPALLRLAGGKVLGTWQQCKQQMLSELDHTE